jgi:DNA-binding Xre family transcriptional regulator
MNHFEYAKVSKTIRQIMKSKRMTYGSFAKPLNMSDSGLKKLLAAKDCSLNKLSAICSVLSVDIEELLRSSQDIKSMEIKFTEAQEEFFKKNPDHFFFFCELIDNEMTLDKLQSIYKLNAESMRRYLTSLDKIGLIEMHPGNLVKHKYGGKTHWNMAASPIGQRAMLEFQDGFLKKLHAPDLQSKRPRVLRWVNFRFRKNTYEDFVAASNCLVQEFIQRAYREKPLSDPEDLIPAALLLGLMEFKYPDILKIPNIGK